MKNLITLSKTELKSTAKNLVQSNVSILKSNFKNVANYEALKSVFYSLKEVSDAKKQAIANNERKVKFAKENKISVKVFDSALQMLSLIKLINYSTGHSMGCSKRISICGIKGNYCVKSTSTCTDYAKSCSYKAIHGSINITFSIAEIKELVKNYEFQSIGGVDTFVEKSNGKIKKAIWLSGKGNKNTYFVEKTNGFLTSNYHGFTVAECETWRKNQAIRLKMSRMTSEQKTDLLMARFVGLQHSKKVGNCEVGTKEFAKRHGLDLKMGYQVSYLISLEDTLFTRRLLDAFN
jgi:hypothetical protein